MRLMNLSQRQHARWNDNGAPQLWHIIKEKTLIEETVEYMNTPDEYNSALMSTLEPPEWELALAAHFLDLEDGSAGESGSVAKRITQFLAQQRALRSDEDYEPEYDNPIQEFLWFVKTEKISMS